MEWTIINIKFKHKAYSFNTKEVLYISDNANQLSQLNASLMNLSWINTVVKHYTQKALLLKIDLDAKKGEFFMDSKTENDGKPPSDKTVEYEMAEEKEIVLLAKKYAKTKSTAERLQKLSGELELKIGIIRTLMANQRAEANLQ